MALGTGLNTQVGIAEESTYGTPVTVTRFYEVVSESLGLNKNAITSNALRAGVRQARRSSRRVVSSRDGSGDLNMEVAVSGFGLWFKHMLGGTPTVVQQGATPAYLHTYTSGDIDGRSLTVQKGVAQTDGTVKPFTFHGCKIPSWEFGLSVDSMLTLRVGIDAEDVDTATSLATVSYTNADLFNFMGASVNYDGSEVAAVTDFTLAGENPMKNNRYYIGSNGLKREPLANDHLGLSGNMTAEFTDMDFYTNYTADTAAELVLEFQGDLISGAHYETLTITVPDIRLDGETPKAGGPDVVTQTVPYIGLYNGTDPSITIEYKTTDTAV